LWKERYPLARHSHNTLEKPGIETIQYHDEYLQTREDRWFPYAEGIYIAKSVYNTINMKALQHRVAHDAKIEHEH
jgi:hypothetical protein